MDIVYLLLLAGLCAATWGFLALCHAVRDR